MELVESFSIVILKDSVTIYLLRKLSLFVYKTFRKSFSLNFSVTEFQLSKSHRFFINKTELNLVWCVLWSKFHTETIVKWVVTRTVDLKGCKNGRTLSSVSSYTELVLVRFLNKVKTYTRPWNSERPAINHPLVYTGQCDLFK